MAQLARHNQHWKDAAIERSEVITDAWEVTKVITGRLAEWILFGCMIANIIGILPGVSLPLLVTNIIMGVQIVTLDIAGFGLATMAENARATGAEKAATNAQRTAYLLIGIMMLTLLIFTLGLMVPSIREYTDIAEKVLILVRVALIVLYGHVIHSLRRMSTRVPAAREVALLHEQMEAQHMEMERILQQHTQEIQHTVARIEELVQMHVQAVTEEILQRFSGTVSNVPQTFAMVPEAHEPITETLPLQGSIKDAVKPVQDVSETDRNAIISTHEQGIARRNICAHLGWGSGKYSIVKSVLDAHQQQQNEEVTA